MHSSGLGGPVWYFLVAVMVLTIGLAVFVVIDSVRRLIRCGPDQRPWLLFYACLQALFLLMLAIVQLKVLPTVFSAIIVFFSPLALIQSIAYLLRVVFPKHAEDVAECELGADAATAPPPPAAQ